MVFFLIINEMSAYMAVTVGNVSFLGNYNFLHDFIVSFTALLVFVQVSEGLFGRIIHNR